MKQYFYIDSNNQQVGPISEDALMGLMKCGAISRQTLIWTEGLEDWLPFGEVFPESGEETSMPALGVESSITETEVPAEVMPRVLPKLWSKYRKHFIIGGAVALIAVSSLSAYLVSEIVDSFYPVSASSKKKKVKPRKISKEKAIQELRKLGVISSELDIQSGVGGRAMANACAQGNINITELLLAGGVNVGQISEYGVLLGAAKNGHSEVVKLLLAAPGIDVNLGGLLAEAAKNGHAEVVKLLLAAPGIDVNKGEPLTKAAENGHAEVVKLLLAAPGIDVNKECEDWYNSEDDCEDGHGSTPLERAAENGHTEVVKLLLAVPGIKYTRALYFADENGHTEIVKLLRAAGARE